MSESKVQNNSNRYQSCPSEFVLGNGGTQLVTLGAGTYTVSEPEHSGFNVEFSGDCNANGDSTIAAGQHQTCTITNTQQK